LLTSPAGPLFSPERRERLRDANLLWGAERWNKRWGKRVDERDRAKVREAVMRVRSAVDELYREEM